MVATADPIGMLHIGAAASAVWAHDLSLRFYTGAVEGLRERGRVGVLTDALTHQAWSAAVTSKEPLAISAAAEASRLGRETGQAPRGSAKGSQPSRSTASRNANLSVIPLT